MLEQLTQFASSTLSFVFVLGVVIFVHEAGHMMVAKLFGVRVLTFSLGFGKRLWGFTRRETEYRVSLVPLGGYVKMSGELPGEGTDDPADFLNKPRWQRVLVYLAGPAMNAVLAILLFAFLFSIGISVPALQDLQAEVGLVQQDSSGERAGILPGDKILAIDGEEVELWDRVETLLVTADGRVVELRLERDGREFTASVKPKPLDGGGGLSDSAGLRPKELLSVTAVTPGSPAAEAEFKIGDQLVAIGGRPVTNVDGFVEYVRSHPEQEIGVDVLRDGRALSLKVVPHDDGDAVRIGIGLGIFQRYSPGRALIEGVRHSAWVVGNTFFVLKKIFTRRIKAETALSGPLEIAKMSGVAARVGFRYLLYFMGLISVSIGVLNLLPIPVLDGGQISILAVESLMRRDLSLRLKDVVNQVGLVLVVLIMASVLFFDVRKNIPQGVSDFFSNLF